MTNVFAHMRFDYGQTRLGNIASQNAPVPRMRRYIIGACATDAEIHLQVVEFLLARAHDSEDRRSLREHLQVGNSAYDVSEDGTSLQYRADPTVRAATEQAIADANQGASHWLAEAWNDAYGRTPRPGPSYDASIKAVEATYRGVVIPNNGRGTITQVINGLRDGRAKFVFDLEDSRGAAAGANEPPVDTLDVVLDMLRALAYGQRVRHGEDGPVTINTDTEARAALQIAVSLVQFVSDGAFRLR